MAKKPTLRDIAKHADVALSTVSQVLNNKPGVSTEMRQRVLVAADEVGYRPKVTIEAPMASEIKTIGLLTKWNDDGPLRINPFYSHVIAGAERECSRRNISLMYASIEVDDSSQAKSLPVMLLDERTDGVIVVGAFLDETVTHISQRSGQNLVMVDAYVSAGNGFDSVLIDNVNGATTAINHLLENGHQHIAMVGGDDEGHPSVQERRQTYVNLLKRHGLTPIIEDSALKQRSAYEATTRLMERHPQVTAIFGCADIVAIGAMNALQNMGLDIPGDVSVIGFDDIDLSRELTPSLTTIRVDKVLMGAMAVRFLIDRMTDPLRTSLKTLVATKLVERESVRDIS